MQSYGSYSVTGSLLLGDMGTALMIMRLAPSAAIADIIAARANANTRASDPRADVGHGGVDDGVSRHERDDRRRTLAPDL